MIKNDNNLFFTCSLIEFIGRIRKLKRKDVVDMLERKNIQHIYNYADILHCEPITTVTDEYIKICNIKSGNFDNISTCKYDIPSYWDIGKVYSRLIQDIAGINENKNIIDILEEIYRSWISDSISNYNSDFFYQSRDYIRECYKEGSVI